MPTCWNSSPRSTATDGRRGRRAFSLVELLVATTVLTLIMVVVAQMVAGTTRATSASRKHLDADREARVVFDRMAGDFARIVKRRDVDSLFVKNGAVDGSSGVNDAMFFFSESPGFYSGATNQSPVSLVGYRVNSRYQLERLSKGLAWDTTASTADTLNFLAYNPATALADTATTIAGRWPQVVGSPAGSSTGNDPDFHVLSSAVFRMEICFEVRDITHLSSPYVTGSNYPVANINASDASPSVNHVTVGSVAPTGSTVRVRDRWYDTANRRTWVCATGQTTTGGTITWSPQGLDDVALVVITLAVLDNNSSLPIQTTGSLNPTAGDAMVKALTDPVQTKLAQPSPSPYPNLGQYVTPAFPSQTWRAVLPNFAGTASIPVSTAAQVRVYQRVFSLNYP